MKSSLDQRAFVRRSLWALPALFLAVRLMLVVALPLEGLRGYGDLTNFFRISGLGWPLLDYWVEFPPLFPWLSRWLYLASAGQEHIYDYLLVFLLTCFQAATLVVFEMIAEEIFSPSQAELRTRVFFAILVCLCYGWWYFDPIPVFFMLLGLFWVLKGQDLGAGVSLFLGTITKFFPALLLPVVWRLRPPRRAVFVTALTIGIAVVAYLGFFLFSPGYTVASLRSQIAKGSWETVWALVDRNFNTGNFGPLVERYDPALARNLQGNPPRVPSMLTLLPFLALGGWVFWRGRVHNHLTAIAFLGLTWCIFLLWSPGWSPQWVLYLIPLILLTLPSREGLLMVVLLVFVNLLEWPVLLSRGYNWALWFTVPLRTLLFALLAYIWYRQLASLRIGPAYLPAGLLSAPEDTMQTQEI